MRQGKEDGRQGTKTWDREQKTQDKGQRRETWDRERAPQSRVVRQGIEDGDKEQRRETGDTRNRDVRQGTKGVRQGIGEG